MSKENNAAENVDVNAQLAEALKENEALKASLKELNEELAKVSDESAKKDKNPVIKVGKDAYELKVKKFIFNKGGKNIIVTQDVLENDPELVKELIAKGSGCLVKKGGK